MSKNKQDMRIELIQVEFLQANDWNPNVMQEEEYEALKQDMHIHGVNGIDPILVSPAEFFHGLKDEELKDYYVIVDGEHRWRAAVQLAWKDIRCEIRDITEEDAKALCYRRNRERGTIDPFKEALLFKSEIEANLAQKTIAGKYGIDQSTVSHRLSLLKLDSKVLETIQHVPHGIITPSHLEPLATLTPEDQVLVTKRLVEEVKNYGRPESVKEIQEHAEQIKKERAENEALSKALETAKHPKCPVCRQKPERLDYTGLPWVRCRSWHDWNIDTGKRRYEPITRSQNTLDGKAKPIQSKVIRCSHTIKELADVFGDRCREIVPKMDKVTSIRIHGHLENASFSIDFSAYGSCTSFSINHGHRQLWFRAEGHDYKTGEKSTVDAGTPNNVEDVKKLIESAFQGKLEIPISKRIKGKIPEPPTSAIPEKEISS